MVWWNEGVFDSPCWRAVAPAFGFIANKNVGINDWRLGVMFRFFQMCVLAYVAWDVVNQKSYLYREVPQINFQPIIAGDANLTRAMEESLTNPPRYCTNSSSYEYTLEASSGGASASFGNNGSTPLECLILDGDIVATTIGPDTIMFATYIREEVTRTRDNVTALADCPDKATVYTEDGQYALDPTFLSGRCSYKLIKHSLPVAPENMTLGFSFSYTAQSSDIRASGNSGDLTCSLKADIDEAVTQTFADGQFVISMPIWRWLEMAHVDLDEDIAQRDNLAQGANSDLSVNGTLPMARVTGVQFQVSVSLYNEGLQPYGQAGRNERVCNIELKPTLFWTPGPTQVFRLWDQLPNIGLSSVQPYGILFTFQGGGSFGTFSYKNLITALIAGAVLLNVAHTITTYVALYTLGVRSKLYGNFINEKCDYKREFARYAAQSLIAGDFFRRQDVNSTESLDRAEIYKSLAGLFDGKLPVDELAALTDFVIKVGDRTKSKLDGEETRVEGEISMEEWLNVFTDDRCTMGMLRKIIDSEYNEEERAELEVPASPCKADVEAEKGEYNEGAPNSGGPPPMI